MSCSALLHRRELVYLQPYASARLLHPLVRLQSHVFDIMHQGQHLCTSCRSWRAAAQRGPHRSWPAHPTRPAWVRTGFQQIHMVCVGSTADSKGYFRYYLCCSKHFFTLGVRVALPTSDVCLLTLLSKA